MVVGSDSAGKRERVAQIHLLFEEFADCHQSVCHLVGHLGWVDLHFGRHLPLPGSAWGDGEIGRNGWARLNQNQPTSTPNYPSKWLQKCLD